MQNKFVLFVIGDDRPGIVAAVSEVLYKNSFNIEDSSMTILERQFAMILIISSEGNFRVPELKKIFKEAEKKLNLFISVKRLASMSDEGTGHIETEPYIITLIGADRIGIVYRITKLISDQGINISDVRTEIIGEESKPIYTMVLEVGIPADVNLTKFKSKFKRLEKELNVTITLKSIDVLEL